MNQQLFGRNPNLPGELQKKETGFQEIFKKI
jgi:hypothetical protein